MLSPVPVPILWPSQGVWVSPKPLPGPGETLPAFFSGHSRSSLHILLYCFVQSVHTNTFSTRQAPGPCLEVNKYFS